MRRLIRVAATVVLAACTSSRSEPVTEPVALSAGHPVVIAHRGASAYAPEHTHAAWERALDMGADYIEQDLQMTGDGVLIVMHDDTLDRTTRGAPCRGAVNARTWADIRDCDAGSWFDPAFATERIPMLDDVLGRYAGRARFYIETKNPDEAPGMEDALVALLRAHRIANGEMRDGLPVVILQSFSAESLHRLARLAPAIPRVQLLHADPPGQILARLDSIAEYAQGIGPSRRSVDARLIAEAHRRRLAVHPYTANDEGEMRRLLDLGVDGMFTDRPDVLLRMR